MRASKGTLIVAVVAVFVAMTASPGLAGDQRGKIVPPPPGVSAAPVMVGSSLTAGDTYLITQDNEDNGGTGSPDGDMGGGNPPCVFDGDTGG